MFHIAAPILKCCCRYHHRSPNIINIMTWPLQPRNQESCVLSPCLPNWERLPLQSCRHRYNFVRGLWQKSKHHKGYCCYHFDFRLCPKKLCPKLPGTTSMNAMLWNSLPTATATTARRHHAAPLTSTKKSMRTICDRDAMPLWSKWCWFLSN